ncbi:MAG: thiamine-phosphate pyrophosphorylase [Candidatus Omnitrophota bacterium]
MFKDIDKQKILRIIDANLNRTREALRVCEDISRFILEDKRISRRLKLTRQKVFTVIRDSGLDYLKILENRNSVDDVGKRTTAAESTRANWQAVFLANIERAKEAARALEEFSKIINKELAQRFKRIRFTIYDIEKETIIRYKSLSRT